LQTSQQRKRGRTNGTSKLELISLIANMINIRLTNVR
jgi:hypothetical protein